MQPTAVWRIEEELGSIRACVNTTRSCCSNQHHVDIKSTHERNLLLLVTVSVAPHHACRLIFLHTNLRIPVLLNLTPLAPRLAPATFAAVTSTSTRLDAVPMSNFQDATRLSSSPTPLLPSQPHLCHQSPSTSSAEEPLSFVLFDGHTGRSQHATAASDSLLLLADGTEVSSQTGASQPLAQWLKGRNVDEQQTVIYAYSRELLVQASSSPTTAPSSPPHATLSLPLSSVSLVFTPPAASLTPSTTAYPRLSASASVVLRSLPDYIRIFTQQLAVVTSAIEHIDHTTQCTRTSLQQLAAADMSLTPLRAYAHNTLLQHVETTSKLWQQWQQLSKTQQSALDTFDFRLSELADIALPASISGGRNGSTLLECVDERALRESAEKARREKDKSEWKRNEARRQEDDVRAALEAFAPYLPQEEEVQVRAVVDGWSSGDKRRECVGWMNRLMEMRDEAQRYCQQIEGRLQSSAPSFAELEREVRVKQMEMEGWNRRNKEEETSVYQHIATYKHAAAQLLAFSVSFFTHHSASLAHCFAALSTLSSLSASLPLYHRLLTHSIDSFTPLIRLNRLAQSYNEALYEVHRRAERRLRRQKEVTAVVERWRKEETEERERRLSWWQEWGVNLPASLQLGLKEDSGWLKVEVCNWDGQLPLVTDEEVQRLKKGVAGGEMEERKEALAENEDDEPLEDRLKRLVAENAALRAELQQKQQQPAITATALAAPVAVDELSTLRVEVDRRQALLNDANKTNAWLEEELNKREEELTVERSRRDKSDRDSREVAMKLVAHVKERTRERARFNECERDRLAWLDRCNERVTLLQPAVNDMVMAVRVTSVDGEKERSSTGSAATPVYRVRLAGDGTRSMFLSAESMSVMREKRAGSGVWPEWVVGHVVELVGKRAAGSVREVEAGLKSGEEYWMATVALVDFSDRHSSENAGVGEGNNNSSQHSSSSSSSASLSSAALEALVLATP